MRLLYSIAWWLALPLVCWRLWSRGRREPGYREHVGERFSLYPKTRPTPGAIWVHAVSVGETRAAQPLVDALLAADPEAQVLLTHMTPTGRETGSTLFAPYGARVKQVYLPYDTGTMMGRFLRRFRPRLCILMETEVWPNLIHQCQLNNVPVALVNARLSERSLRKGLRFAAIIQPAAHALTLVAAQTSDDAERIRKLGAQNVQITGSLKFDVTPPMAALETSAKLRAWYGKRDVLVCGCTRDGEEQMILDALAELRGNLPLLVIVPRHPQRFAAVEHILQTLGVRYQRRTTLGVESLDPEIEVVLGDSMGEMFAYYASADVAFVGGSLKPLGGHNLIEPCSVGRATLVGLHTFNFLDITEEAIAEGAAKRVEGALELMHCASNLFANTEQRKGMAQSAQMFATLHRGATQRTVDLLQPLLNQGNTEHW